MEYRHTQTGWVIIVTLGSMGIIALVLAVSTGEHFAFIPAAILLVSGVLFWNLTVAVDDYVVAISFGIGLIRKRFPISEIVSCESVKNRWWHGWGIHGGFGKWLYNVSGFDAVELRMRDGRLARIGTDEPQQLCEAIQKKLVNRRDSEKTQRARSEK